MNGADTGHLKKNGRQCPYCCVRYGDVHDEGCPSREAKIARAQKNKIDLNSQEDQPS